jgi:hypothetical protein
MNTNSEFQKWIALAPLRDIKAAEEHYLHRNLTEQRLRIPLAVIDANSRYCRALERCGGDPKKLFKRFFRIDQDEFEAALAADPPIPEDPDAPEWVRVQQRMNSYMLKLASMTQFASGGAVSPSTKLNSAKFIEVRKKMREKHRDDLLERRWVRLSSSLRSIRAFLGGVADDLQSTDLQKKSDAESRLLDPFKNVVHVLATMPRSLRAQAFCELLQGRNEFARVPVIKGEELRVRIPLHVPLFEPSGLQWKLVVYDRSLSMWVPASADLLELSRLKLEDLAHANLPLANRLIQLVTHSDEVSILDDWSKESLPFLKLIKFSGAQMSWQGVIKDSMRIFGKRIKSSNELAEVLGLLLIGNEKFSKFLECETDRVSAWDSVPSEDISTEKLRRLYSAFNRRTGKFKEAAEQWIPDPKDLGILLRSIRADSCFRKVSSHHLAHYPVFQTVVAERVERTKKRENNLLNNLQ